MAETGNSETSAGRRSQPVNWKALLAPYRQPEVWRSVFQLLNTAIPLVALWLLMLWSLDVGYWLTLLLAVPAALLVVRMFMFQHDCGHASFFESLKTNNAVGSVIGVLTLVPYAYWRKTHAIHHATSGNLDERSFGDIDTLTVREYLSLTPFKRLLYRLYRNPAVMLIVGPVYQFVFKHRLPLDTPRSWKREWASVFWNNLAIVTVVALMWLVVGIDRFLMVQLPITLIAGSVGVYLFYVQHQYEKAYWRYREEWNYWDAALRGASHLTMPRWLQWFTGNIGLHHIHHMNSRIPNYHLQRCYDDNAALHDVNQLALARSTKMLRLALWDEDDQRLVRFKDLHTIRPRLERDLVAGQTIHPTKPEAVPRAWR